MKTGWLHPRLAPVALFVLAVLIRAFSFRLVIGADGISPRGNDSFYHLRRIAYSVANFPATLDFDPYINFPAGARPIWTPVMDWLLALIAWPFATGLGSGNLASLSSVEAIIIWAPPALGGLSVVMVYAMARPRFGSAVAITAGLILCLLPAHVWYSQVGFVDHHVVVAATSWIAVMAAMRWLERDSSLGGGATWWAAASAGTAFAVAILAWPGSVYHVALLEIGLLIYLLSRSERAWATRCALQFALANAVALVLVLPLTVSSSWEQWAPFSPVVLSEFQPWFFGVLSVYGGGSAGIWRHTGLDHRRRWVTGILFGLALLFISFAMIPDLREGAIEALRWFSRTESFQVQVKESVPLLFKEGQFSIDWAVRYLSIFVLVVPLALAAASAVAWRCRQHRASLLLLLWFTAGLFAATLTQRRFANSFSLPMALLMGWACCSIYRAALSRMFGRPGARALAMLIACALAGLLLVPAALFYQRAFRLELALQRGLSGAIPAQVLRHRRMVEVALFLRDHTPPTSGWLDASIEPEYAVLGHWSIGHRIEYLARRPTVTNAFGNDIGRSLFQSAQDYFTLPEPRAVQLLQEMRVRYVVAGREAPTSREDLRPDSMFRSLYLRDGSEKRGVGSRGPGHPALEQHRLLFETGPAPLTGPDGPAAFKVFEYVRGATISGRTAPGGSVRASLHLQSNRGRRIEYSATARASSDGEFTLRVPYATNSHPGLSRVEGAYSLECGEESIEIWIDEIQVREGRAVRLPNLCLDSISESAWNPHRSALTTARDSLL